jgi:hypothetical protein
MSNILRNQTIYTGITTTLYSIILFAVSLILIIIIKYKAKKK